MNYKTLIIDPSPKSLHYEIENLQKRGLNVLGVSNFKEAIEILLSDGDIQVVLTEMTIPTEAGSAKNIKGAQLFEEINKARYEVSIFLYTNITQFKKYDTGGVINGYFYKQENDFEDIVRKVRADVINSKIDTPFYEKLVEYSGKSKDAWHTPGHSSGYSVKKSPWVSDFYEFFGENLFTSDISVSVPMLDSLLHPKGVIKEAQELAARAFASRYTFFSTNGTSTSNKILLQTLLKPGDAILLDRNCHKSVHYAVIAAGAEPIYLMPSVNNKYGIFGPIPIKRIISTMDTAIKAKKQLKVLILTNCTYDGLISDIPTIVNEAHKRNIKVIVDEAWFGFANFHPEFYPCAMKAGADYATQSTHKTMSAFSQASMIHVNDPDFENIQDFFMENFNMQTSTSPQYPMIASLDVSRKQMVLEGFKLLERSLELSKTLRKSINSLEKFRVLEKEDLITEELQGDNIKLDKTKLTIDITRTCMTSKEIEHILLTKHNIQIEKTTFNTITVLITIGSNFSKLNRLYLALESIEKLSGARTENTSQKVLSNFKLTLSPLKYLPRFSFYANGESILLDEAQNRISKVMVTPYPPGIPLLVPGQLITKEIINTLYFYQDYGVEIHGINGSVIKVLTKEEEKRLKNGGYEIK